MTALPHAPTVDGWFASLYTCSLCGIRNVDFNASDVSDGPALELRGRIDQIAAIYDAVRQRYGLPDFQVDVIITDQLADCVDGLMRRLVPHMPPYDIARAASVVVGRCVPLTHDWTETCLVLDADVLLREDTRDQALTLFLLAHEMAHPMLSLQSRLIGAMKDQGIEIGFNETAQNTARLFAEEYRADVLADFYLGQVVTIGPAPDSRRATCWDIEGPDLENAAMGALTGAHPLWADLIDDYRNWRAELLPTVKDVMRRVDHALTLVVHLQAAIDRAQPNAELGPHALTQQPFAALPAVNLYLDSWASLIDVIRRTPPIYDLDAARSFDRSIIEVGEPAIMEIWRTLGIAIEHNSDGTVNINIAEPRR